MRIYQGNCLDILKEMKDESIDCVVTSPPYYGLRDYGVEGQIGQEKSAEDYVWALMQIFDEVKRVLKKTGTCWVNLGDTYGGTSSKGNWQDPKYPDGRNGQKKSVTAGIQEKCLLQIPSRFALAMTSRDWILRNEIIWHKPNAMPASAKDRFTVDHEKLFFFTKSKDYYFEQQFEAYTKPMDRWGGEKLVATTAGSDWDKNTGHGIYRHRNMRPDPRGKNKRTVWSIVTKPFKDAHFAVFPEALIETPIKAGCPPQGKVLDPFMGSGTTLVVAEREGRDGIGIELNQAYVDIANKRLNANAKLAT